MTQLRRGARVQRGLTADLQGKGGWRAFLLLLLLRVQRGLTADLQKPEEGTQDTDVGEHDPEGNQGHCLSDDVVDEEVAAAGQGCPH